MDIGNRLSDNLAHIYFFYPFPFVITRAAQKVMTSAGAYKRFAHFAGHWDLHWDFYSGKRSSTGFLTWMFSTQNVVYPTVHNRPNMRSPSFITLTLFKVK